VVGNGGGRGVGICIPAIQGVVPPFPGPLGGSERELKQANKPDESAMPWGSPRVILHDPQPLCPPQQYETTAYIPHWRGEAEAIAARKVHGLENGLVDLLRRGGASVSRVGVGSW
jgi:hypothetical protein